MRPWEDRLGPEVDSNEKAPDEDGGWRHERVVLRPDSDQPGFAPIVIRVDGNDDSFSVVAELLMILDEPDA